MKNKVNNLDELVEKWTLEGHKPIGVLSDFPIKRNFNKKKNHDISFKQLLSQLEFLSEKSFSRYIPALFPPHIPGFLDRFQDWLSNDGITPAQQRHMFEFTLRIAYFSFEDFIQLYRSAFVGPVTRWIIDSLELSLLDANFNQQIENEKKKHTWYCPITDSMVISEFYHANHISGIDLRPPFRVFKGLYEINYYPEYLPKLLKKYMQNKNLERLVLMEDFVGSGTQTLAVVDWAVNNLDCPILFTPMIVCPDGAKALDALANKYPDRLCIEPVLQLDDSVFVAPKNNSNNLLFKKIKEFAEAIHPSIKGEPDTSYGPYGYFKRGDQMTGATIVLFSNTPDNTLPFIHHHEKYPSTWKALFPRVSRETA